MSVASPRTARSTRCWVSGCIGTVEPQCVAVRCAIRGDVADQNVIKLRRAAEPKGGVRHASRYTARATTCGELDDAMTVAAQAGTGVYIEVVTDTYAASKLVRQLHDNLASLYNT
jgi:hypothetical protein